MQLLGSFRKGGHLLWPLCMPRSVEAVRVHEATCVFSSRESSEEIAFCCLWCTHFQVLPRDVAASHVPFLFLWGMQGCLQHQLCNQGGALGQSFAPAWRGTLDRCPSGFALVMALVWSNVYASPSQISFDGLNPNLFGGHEPQFPTWWISLLS